MPVAKGQLNKRLLVGIVLDRSSSMESIKKETISGTNEQFSALRDSDDAANTSVAFFSFNHEVTPVFKDDDGAAKFVPCSSLKDISDADYFPSGMTAMYDAVGDAIDFFAGEAKKADDVLIVVISDGCENASKRFDSEKVAGRVKELQDSGWNFTYIGANQDLSTVAKQLGFHEGNMLQFESSSAGTVQMGNTVSSAISNYTLTRSQNIAAGVETRCSTQSLYDSSGKAEDSGNLTVSSGEGTTVTTTGEPVDEDVKESQDGIA
jgi:hypothetical protein